MKLRSRFFLSASLAVLVGLTNFSYAEEAGASADASADQATSSALSAGEFDARRSLRTALQLLESGETDRAISALGNLLDQYPSSSIRFKANLELGRHALEKDQDVDRAIEHFKVCEDMLDGLEEGQSLTGDDLDIYLESLYLTGVGYYTEGNYPKLFNTMRKVTVGYPNSVWANQAYYYIGMAHFLQQNWGKAIKYLQMVGTFVDPEAAEMRFVEAGQRIFIKVEDGDLPIIEDLGGGGAVRLTTKSGDMLELPLTALSRTKSIYVASAETRMGQPDTTDNALQIIGGDAIKVEYLDANTESGEANVVRTEIVDVVSTGKAVFTTAVYEGSSDDALIGQPVFVLLSDADLDTSPEAQEVTIRVTAQYEDEQKQEEGSIDFSVDDGSADEGSVWRVRDEVQLTLTEKANEMDEEELGALVQHHTGHFVGQVNLIEAKSGVSIDTSDDKLACFAQDRITVSYIDELHAEGEFKRVVEVSIPVIGLYSGSFSPVDSDLEDPVDTARKNVIQARGLYSLAKIYDDMGLKKGAKGQVDQGMERVDEVILSEDEIPGEFVQEAFKLRWQMQILSEDLPGAIATCQAFNRQFPESRFADQALLDIGRALLELARTTAEVETDGNSYYEDARMVFQTIVDLEASDVKPEAQFLIAQSIEEEQERLEAAIPAYHAVAKNYPQSEYAGESLGKLVQYHIESGDFIAATDMLEQVFEEHPDKQWLDGMLVRWVVMAYRMKNYTLAMEKAQQLIMEYPQSQYASQVRGMMERIRKRMDSAG